MSDPRLQRWALLALLAAACTSEAFDESLRDELLARYETDQGLRNTIAQLMRRGETPDSSLWLRQAAIDSVNSGWLKTLVTERGWPGRSLVGREASHAAYLIAQHAVHDPQFQAQVLELLEEAHAAGEATAGEVAYLTDRIAVQAGHPQQYGTQFGIIDGKVVFNPIEDSVNVDRRRAEMGLPPIAEYARQADSMFTTGSR